MIDNAQTATSPTIRYLGEFPFFMDELTTILGTATGSIRIACDFPGFGMYSSHDRYQRYADMITTTASRLTDLKMVVLNEAGRDLALQVQFSSLRLDDLLRDDNPKLDGLLSRLGRSRNEVQSLDDFRRLLLEDQRVALHSHFGQLDRRELAGNIPINIWIVDGERAVFGVPRLGAGVHEMAFETSASQVVAQLRKAFDSLFGGATAIR